MNLSYGNPISEYLYAILLLSDIFKDTVKVYFPLGLTVSHLPIMLVLCFQIQN